MSENALDRKGELGRYSTRPNQKLTPQCERNFTPPELGAMEMVLWAYKNYILVRKKNNINNTLIPDYYYLEALMINLISDLFVLMFYVQVSHHFFSHVRVLSCLPGLNQCYKQRIKCLA